MYPHPEKLNKNIQKGFTLVEALVALMILTIALGPALVLSSNISSTASVIQNNLIAANLAQEGIEVVRSFRDANWFNGLPFDTGMADGIYRVGLRSTSLSSLDLNPPIKIDAGMYNYISGTDTIFRRTITITKINSEELRIISDVTWTERGNRPRDVRVESHLFDWK
ncbi:MAG: prepilin-type N-terminal cleavage/methylation domain-containing protein [Candidatus Yanofskybacteria bacterium]|nr:prepilin-type N-terminal cleavage/methylation domain-containing protein [Candidatus Yanofskybacteria bacterium]